MITPASGGWSAIAPVGRDAPSSRMEAVEVKPGARHVVFHAFDDETITEGEGRPGYYDGTIPMYLVKKPPRPSWPRR